MGNGAGVPSPRRPPHGSSDFLKAAGAVASTGLLSSLLAACGGSATSTSGHVDRRRRPTGTIAVALVAAASA
jgi:hypothetical protein